MLFQPFVPVFANNSNTGDITNAETQFLDAYNKIEALEKIDISEVELLVKAAQGAENLGHGVVNGAKGVYNAFDNLITGGKNQVEYDKYSDYIQQIKDANDKIVEAKAQAKCMKSAFDAGGIDAAKNADPSKVSRGSLETQLKAMDDARKALNDAGKCLKEVGNVMSGIAKIFAGLGTVIGLIGLIPGATAVCEPISLAFNLAGDLLTPCAECMKSAGDGLIAAAQEGAFSEAGTYSLDNVKNTAVKEFPKAAFNVVLDVAGSGVTGSADAAKDATVNAARSTSSRFLGDAGGEAVEELAKKFWSPTTGFVADVFKAFGTSKGWQFTDDAYKVASKLFTGVPSALSSFSQAFGGPKIEFPKIPGIKDAEKVVVGDISGAVADTFLPTHEPDVNYEGDDE